MKLHLILLPGIFQLFSYHYNNINLPCSKVRKHFTDTWELHCPENTMNNLRQLQPCTAEHKIKCVLLGWSYRGWNATTRAGIGSKELQPMPQFLENCDRKASVPSARPGHGNNFISCSTSKVPEQGRGSLKAPKGDTDFLRSSTSKS